MHRTLILIAGLIAMALLAVWCLDRHVGEIQADILARANAALAERGLRLGATVSGQDVTLSGSVADQRRLDQALALVAALPGVRMVDSMVTVQAPPPAPSGPYTFQARADAQRLILTGTVPDDAARASIVGAARQVFRERDVIDQLVLRPEAPPEFARAVKAALEPLHGLQDGQLLLRDRQATLSGMVDDARHMESAERALAAGLPRGYSASARLTPAPRSATRIAGCQTDLDRVVQQQSVGFAAGSDRIDADSYPLLDRLAVAIKDCGGVLVQILGHTDSRGAAESNLALSQRRAEAVADYLVREGVPAGQLVPRGYGESRPLTDNDTAAGRARNRRIEFRAGAAGDGGA